MPPQGDGPEQGSLPRPRSLASHRCARGWPLCVVTPPKHGVAIRGMLWYCCVVWYCMVWYGMVWYGMVWYGMI